MSVRGPYVGAEEPLALGIRINDFHVTKDIREMKPETSLKVTSEANPEIITAYK